MAEYMVLIYEDETAWAEAGEETLAEVLAEHRRFIQRNQPVLRGGHALHPSASATSMRRDAAGEAVVTDGAFAETKEILGGYYVIEAADLDQALALAKQIPTPFGGVEVRPVRVVNPPQ